MLIARHAVLEDKIVAQPVSPIITNLTELLRPQGVIILPRQGITLTQISTEHVTPLATIVLEMPIINVLNVPLVLKNYN
jgi:hypothetical protein